MSSGIDLHVWVDEDPPAQPGGFALTAWELGKPRRRPHADLGQCRRPPDAAMASVDMVIVGADRVTRTGDAANKIGTYLKALAAHDNDVGFHVAFPSTTVDWRISDGVADIPIEERPQTEVSTVTGRAMDGSIATVRVTPSSSPAANPAFDVTPHRLITSLITERGRCAPGDLGVLFPEEG